MSQQQDGLSKSQISNLMFFMGLFMVALGTFGASAPQQLADIIGLDIETAQILSFSLCFVGVVDIIVAKTILKPNNRK